MQRETSPMLNSLTESPSTTGARLGIAGYSDRDGQERRRAGSDGEKRCQEHREFHRQTNCARNPGIHLQGKIIGS